jgi:Na+/melibiose symporter-like transporter
MDNDPSCWVSNESCHTPCVIQNTTGCMDVLTKHSVGEAALTFIYVVFGVIGVCVMYVVILTATERYRQEVHLSRRTTRSNINHNDDEYFDMHEITQGSQTCGVEPASVLGIADIEDNQETILYASADPATQDPSSTSV